MSDQTQPRQSQDRQPGREAEMSPEPDYMPRFPGAGKLKGKVALVTGGDSGIGRAVAVHFAREGADVAIIYLDEDGDAAKTAELVESEGRKCARFRGDIRQEAFCKDAVTRTVGELGRLDILVNNAGEQHLESPEDPFAIDTEQLTRTFETNVFAMFHLSRAALEHLPKGGTIINTTSVTAYKGKKTLIDYSSTKGAIVSFTRSLSQALVDRGIRVNAVAPGPIWTPLIPATFTAEMAAEHGAHSAMGRPGQPNEVAPSYVFLASEDGSYMTGQVLHPNGGTIVAS